MDRRMQDCYFYYYSTCTKGEHCGFRHEPSALGCETTCPLWFEGKCQNEHCHMRHMELKKNRKTIPCYWESQPGGCRKPHCPFLHKSARDPPLPGQQEKQDCPGPVAGTAPAMEPRGVLEPRGALGARGCDQTLPDPLLVSFQERMHLY